MQLYMSLTLSVFIVQQNGEGVIVVLETSRLILRPWKETDAENLYEQARNPLVGPIAGWPIHTSVENSRQIIRDVLSADGTYAITLKGGDKAIGSIGLMIGNNSDLGIGDDEAEIGYWIGEPYWGKGLIPEAVLELMKFAFDELDLNTLWCGYFDGNDRSKRVLEKCGFHFHHTERNKAWPLMGSTRTQHVMHITKKEWCSARTYEPVGPCSEGP